MIVITQGLLAAKIQSLFWRAFSPSKDTVLHCLFTGTVDELLFLTVRKGYKKYLQLASFFIHLDGIM